MCQVVVFVHHYLSATSCHGYPEKVSLERTQLYESRSHRFVLPYGETQPIHDTQLSQSHREQSGWLFCEGQRSLTHPSFVVVCDELIRRKQDNRRNTARTYTNLDLELRIGFHHQLGEV